MSVVKSQKSKIILGIDIGGTNTKFALVSGRRVVRFEKVKTARNMAELLKQIELFLGRVKLKGVGVGAAGVIDAARGVVVKAPNMKQFNGVKMVRLIRKKFKVPVKIDNDVRCFARAEAKLGAAKGYKNVLGLAIGTGIGGGLVISGEIYSGIRFAAGEVGHAFFGGMKEWEGIAGKKFFKKFGKSPEKLAESARSGSKSARKAFQERGYNLGIGIANLVNILDPEIVVLGGGAMKEAELFLPTTKKVARRFIFNPRAKNIKIVQGKLGEKAGAIGAALLFTRR